MITCLIIFSPWQYWTINIILILDWGTELTHEYNKLIILYQSCIHGFVYGHHFDPQNIKIIEIITFERVFTYFI